MRAHRERGLGSLLEESILARSEGPLVQVPHAEMLLRLRQLVMSNGDDRLAYARGANRFEASTTTARLHDRLRKGTARLQGRWRGRCHENGG